jgi:hypothetical protein
MILSFRGLDFNIYRYKYKLLKMKKFSKVAGVKVSEKPQVDTPINNVTNKDKIMFLIDQFLTIRTYGPVDRYQRAGLIKIAGKEMLADAIMDLVSESNSKSQIKLLEDLRLETGDWELIDKKIDSMFEEKILLQNRNKFNNLVERWSDGSLLCQFVEDGIEKLQNDKIIRDYINLTLESNLTTETKQKLIQIYTNRLKQITQK